MLPTLADNVGCQPNFHRKDTNSEGSRSDDWLRHGRVGDPLGLDYGWPRRCD
ncbi:hypothetical protein BVRB_2g046830 isoform A [Beta vulgaris subsp. vulgaris]|nr:hypothetical protein BVRB_2g046830 isoform A [Beta vulgaris subsp. vulgaris]